MENIGNIKNKLPENLSGVHIHFVGIKGTGMAALVEILYHNGAIITGSDVEERFYTDEILESLGIKAKTFSKENITDKIEYVIYSSAYKLDKNPDLIAAVEKNLPCLLYTQALGSYSSLYYSCGVCGVHGKTSTTGLVGTILKELDLPTQTLVGSKIKSFGDTCTFTSDAFKQLDSNAENRKNSVFVAETCEYQRHFMEFFPKNIILTSVESDHQDYYPTYESIRDAFVDYICKLPIGGNLIFCSDDKGAVETVKIAHSKRSDINFIPYGINDFSCDLGFNTNPKNGRVKALSKACLDRTYLGFNTNPKNGRVKGLNEVSLDRTYFCDSFNFKILLGKIDDGKQYFKIKCFGDKDFKLSVPGIHEVLDAVAAIALVCKIIEHFGKNPIDFVDTIALGVEKFSGGKRRSEIVSRLKINNNDVIVIDDYGHHPTAVKTTLEGFRNFYKNRKIIVDFMSHTYSRTQSLLKEFSQSFDSADVVILHKIYSSARENPSDFEITGKTLFNEVQKNFKNKENVFYFEEVLDAKDFVLSELQKELPAGCQGYLFVTIGAGDNWKLGKEIGN